MCIYVLRAYIYAYIYNIYIYAYIYNACEYIYKRQIQCKIIGLFCTISSLLYGSFAKETGSFTYIYKRQMRLQLAMYVCMYVCTCVYVNMCSLCLHM